MISPSGRSRASQKARLAKVNRPAQVLAQQANGQAFHQGMVEGLGIAQRLLGSLAGGDVGGDAADGVGLAAVVGENEFLREEGVRPVVLRDHLLELQGAAFLEDPAVVGQERLGLFGRVDVGRLLAYDFVPAEVEQRLPAAVDEKVAPLQVLDVGDDRGVVKDVAQPRLAGPEGGLGSAQAEQGADVREQFMRVHRREQESVRMAVAVGASCGQRLTVAQVQHRNRGRVRVRLDPLAEPGVFQNNQLRLLAPPAPAPLPPWRLPGPGSPPPAGRR